ncbi:MAG: hypothetical protein RUMPE_00945 [Eubacteriales bacterium SKADARSKE-1]|nr:hypothetical protein [Eubacteriales bacterium SKADARSKE-1]
MRTIKIFEDEKEIYSGACSVNTALLKGRLCDKIDQYEGTVRFSVQLSNGKNESTGEWNKPTYAECAAFKDVAKTILDNYKPKDEIWLVCKYYSKKREDKYYKGFYVREIIGGKKPDTSKKQETQKQEATLDDVYLPF